MAPKNIVQLIRTLDHKTKQGLLKWERTVDKKVFQLAFPDYSVTISCEAPIDPMADGRYAIRIYDDEGELIGLYFEDDLISEISIGEARGILREIYDWARRRAHGVGVDEAIDKILSNLENTTSADETSSREFR
jgi:hypothetical protein